MDLHRADKVADWEKVDPSQRNEWQRRAAATNGIDTPANRETAKGLAASLSGLWQIHKGRPLLGSALLLYGRYKDFKDGRVAEATGTKSPLGETFDATADKLSMAAALPVMIEKEIIPRRHGAALFMDHAVASAAVLKAKVTDREIHPSRVGKIASGLQWAGMILLTAGHVSRNYANNNIPDYIEKAGLRTLEVGIALGAVAAAGYVQDACNEQASKIQQPPTQ